MNFMMYSIVFAATLAEPQVEHYQMALGDKICFLADISAELNIGYTTTLGEHVRKFTCHPFGLMLCTKIDCSYCVI